MHRFLLLALICLALAGCMDSVSAPPPQAVGPTAAPSAGAPTAQPGYPAPQGAYPVPPAEATSAYPAPNSSLPEGPKFTINTPLKAADGQVSGTGPAGVPIRVINITRGADPIADLTIGDDGSFKAAVAGKINAGDRIALTLGNTSGTKFNSADFLRGPGYEDLPMVGVVFASTSAE